MRTRSSTCRIVGGLTEPHFSRRRSLDTDRRASHRTALSDLTPPSGGWITTCVGMCRIVRVSGSTITKSAAPALKTSTDNTSAGRQPACSCPLVGSKSTIQISPRWGDGFTTRPALYRPKDANPPSKPPKPQGLGAARRRLDWSGQGTPGGDRSPQPPPTRIGLKIPWRPPAGPRSGAWLNSCAPLLLAYQL